MSLKSLVVNTVVNPPKFFNAPLLNILGLQVVRILLDRLIYHLRFTFVARDVRDAVRHFQEHGYVVIPNFLPPEQFEEIKQEFATAFQPQYKDKIQLRRVGENAIHEAAVLADEKAPYPVSRQLLLRSSFIRNVIEGVSHRKIRLPAACIIQRFSHNESSTSASKVILHHNDTFDVENILHQDHCFSVFKCWYYVDAVTEDNGAFVYAPESHRITWARLKYEYKKSIYYGRLQNGHGDQVPQANLERGRIVPSAEDRVKMGLREQPLVAPANSLVFANTVGFHKRGTLSPGLDRKLIHLDFRRIQSRLNAIPFIDKFSFVENAILKNQRPEKSIEM